MIKQKQLFRHNPGEGVFGDCWRTCIACLLNLQPEAVPHFMPEHWEDSGTATRKMQEFLRSMGYVLIDYAIDGKLEDVLISTGAINPGVYYMLGGTSRNDVGHSVICCDDGIEWDPSLDDSGIVGPMSDGYYWVSFLVSAIMLRK